MKIVIPGGSGQVGRLLAQAWGDAHEVHVLSRSAQGLHHWDGESLGPWAELLEDADVVINLAGRTVDCRYNDRNLRQMMDSRVRSTRVVGEAIAACARPPRLWLQMSTATIYAHSLDRPNDERSGRIGGWEPDAPVYWKHSIDIALAWERELELALVPDCVRKVALRTAMVMTPEPGGVFSVLRRMAQPLRPGWRSSARWRCRRTPSCCSRAATCCRAGCRRRALPFRTPSGARPSGTCSPSPER